MKRESQVCGSRRSAGSTSTKRILTGTLIVLGCFFTARPVAATDEKSIQAFRDAIIKLGPNVDPAEAELVSVTAHHTSRELAREYRVVGPAVFQNFLIHMGTRQRGFCWHWARDIGTRLKELRLKTLYLHWGAADAGTRLEHNVIVVTTPNQSFREGYLIDGWRNAGRLCWWPVTKDSSYKWKEDLQETAWLHDYEFVQSKAVSHPKTAPQPKAAAREKPASPAKAEKTASLEIRG
jgi:hypothetical protein